MSKAKKERYELRNLVAQFFAKGQGTEVKERTLQQILVYVNQGEVQQRTDRIDELATALAKKHQSGGVVTEDEKMVLGKVAQQLFEKEELEVFLRLYDRVNKKADFGFMGAAFFLGLWGSTVFGKDPETLGRFLVVTMVFEVAGSTLERAIQFALFLLEHQRLNFQKILNVWDKLKAQDLTCIPTVTPDNYMAWFEPGAEAKRAPMLTRIERKIPEIIAMFTEIAMVVLHTSWRSAPGGLVNNSRKWVDQLLDALDENPLAQEVFESAIMVLNSTHPTLPIQCQCIFRSVKPGAENNLALLMAKKVVTTTARDSALAALVEPIQCYVTANQCLIVERCQDRLQQRRELEISRGEQALEWLERQRPWLKEELERKRSLIQSQPRRGLRPGGADHIDIEVTPLFNSGIRGIIFHPEERQFPNVRIELLRRMETPHLVSFSFPMVDFQVLRLAEFLGEEKPGSGRPNAEQLKFLLEIVIVNLLYTIVVEGKEPRQRKAVETDQTQTSGPRPIRPHYRRLLPHQHASKAALERAQQTYGKPTGWKLPDGVTFVRARYHEGVLEYNYPTGPIGVYTDRDLFSSGRSS